MPAWTRSFPVATRDCLRVYALLRDRGLLDAGSSAGDREPLVGGETVTLEVTAGGRHRRIRSTDLPPRLREFSTGEVMEAVRSAVPASVWEEMEARRRAYQRDRETRG